MQKIQRLFAFVLAFTLVFSLTIVAAAQDGEPSVTVQDQSIVDGSVTVAEVMAAQDGWIVIHAQADGGIGPVIGQAAVSTGTNTDVVVEIDESAATETLYAMLHVDAGEIGTYEFPGPDGPVVIEGAPVSPPFMVIVAEEMAEATPTPMAEEEVVDATPTAAAEEETVEEEMAEATPTPVAEEEVADATPTAAAEEEMAEEEMAETTPTPVAEEEMAEEEMTEAELLAEFTSSIQVRDQVLQVQDGQSVTVPELFITENGWVVIHLDDNGAPGAVIGQTFVEAGPHYSVSVELNEELTEDTTLWAMLHVDAGEAGTYEFPGPDVPLTLNDEIVMASFRTLAPAVLVNDQEVTEGTVTAEGVVTASDGWLVIHRSNAEGNPGEVIGHAPVAPGVTPNVTVELNGDVTAGEQLWGMLHYDLGTKGEYEFPGADVPVTLAGNVVMTPFIVNPGVMAEGGEAMAEEEMMDDDAMEEEAMEEETMDEEDVADDSMMAEEAPDMLPVTGGSLQENNNALPWMAAIITLLLAGGVALFRRRLV